MDDNITATVKRWVQNLVVAMNLCPFAQRELLSDRVRFWVTTATTDEQLIRALQTELEFLTRNRSIETTLLIHPQVLQDFAAYNQFLDAAEQLLTQMNLDGIYQIASFHPHYQFADAAVDAAQNYTNRAPYALLHLLREDSLAKAIASHPDVSKIPQRNIALMNDLGTLKLQNLLQACFSNTEETESAP